MRNAAYGKIQTASMHLLFSSTSVSSLLFQFSLLQCHFSFTSVSHFSVTSVSIPRICSYLSPQVHHETRHRKGPPSPRPPPHPLPHILRRLDGAVRCKPFKIGGRVARYTENAQVRTILAQCCEAPHSILGVGHSTQHHRVPSARKSQLKFSVKMSGLRV